MGALQKDKLPGLEIGASTNVVDHARCQGGRTCILHAVADSPARGSGHHHGTGASTYLELAGHLPYSAVIGLLGDLQNRAS